MNRGYSFQGIRFGGRVYADLRWQPYIDRSADTQSHETLENDEDHFPLLLLKPPTGAAPVDLILVVTEGVEDDGVDDLVEAATWAVFEAVVAEPDLILVIPDMAWEADRDTDDPPATETPGFHDEQWIVCVYVLDSEDGEDAAELVVLEGMGRVDGEDSTVVYFNPLLCSVGKLMGRC